MTARDPVPVCGWCGETAGWCDCIGCAVNDGNGCEEKPITKEEISP